MEENQKQNYISLFEAAKLCSYSEPYLRLRARQGKLKSIKLGNKWMTTSAWIDDYDARIQAWRENAEAKRAAANVATPVSAPAVLAGVVDRSSAEIEPALLADPLPTWLAEASRRRQLPAVRSASQWDAEPIEQANVSQLVRFGDVVPEGRRDEGACCQRRATSAAGRSFGQMLPAPVRKPDNEVLNYGWFGALLSGAAIALLLFMVARPSAEIETALLAVPLPTLPAVRSMSQWDAQPLVQANVSQSVRFEDAEPKGQGDMLQERATSASGRGDMLQEALIFDGGALDELVDRIARFFEF